MCVTLFDGKRSDALSILIKGGLVAGDSVGIAPWPGPRLMTGSALQRWTLCKRLLLGEMRREGVR